VAQDEREGIPGGCDVRMHGGLGPKWRQRTMAVKQRPKGGAGRSTSHTQVFGGNGGEAGEGREQGGQRGSVRFKSVGEARRRRRAGRLCGRHPGQHTPAR
jgi:hypothetical protein